MENLSFVICLIPAALLLIIAGLYLAARHYRKEAESELEQLRGDWRSYDSARKQVERSISAYASEQQEPFTSRVAELQQALDEINRQAGILSRRRIELKQQANNLGLNRWRTMLGAPYLWYFLRKSAQQLERDIASTYAGLENASRLEQELGRISWSVAQEARQVHNQQRQVHQTLEKLRSQNLQGDTFEAAERRDQQAQAALAQVPVYFFNGDEQAVLAQATREEVSRLHQNLEALRPELDDLLALAQSWVKGCDEAHDEVEVLSRVLSEVEQTLRNLPLGIDTTDYDQRLDKMKVIAQSLVATLSRLEVESIAAVTQEARRLSQLGQEMVHELRRARRELASLDKVTGELAEGFKELSLRLATLGARSSYPISWGVTMKALADLNRQANTLRNAKGGRTPQQIIQDMETAASLHSRQKELSRSCDAFELSHTEFITLLSGPELSQLEAWLPEARQVARKSQVYPTENWRRGEAVDGLLDEINALEEEAGRLALANPSTPIPEDQLNQRLETARVLRTDCQKIQQRVANVRSRLESLEQTEKDAQERLDSIHSVLVQIGFIVRSNEFLSSTALQEYQRLSKDIQGLIAELGKRQVGSVEKKARQGTALIERIEQAVNSWLERLGRDTQELTQELSATLKELDDVAALDEKPVYEARRLLTSDPMFTSVARLRLPLDKATGELKRHSDHWQACMAALSALQDFKPLIETYKEADFQRDKARQALSAATSGMRQKRTWPPTSVTLEEETKELEKIEGEWQALKEGQSRAIARVAQLSNLGARYQALSERIAQAGEKAGREQAEAEELEGQVNESTQMWQNLLYEYSDNPTAGQEIKELLESINHELAQIRRNYNQGKADYNQTLGALKSLLKRLRYYQVALDDESALDASGVVHRRRESSRGERF